MGQEPLPFSPSLAGQMQHTVDSLKAYIRRLNMGWGIPMEEVNKRYKEGIPMKKNLDTLDIMHDAAVEDYHGQEDMISEGGPVHTVSDKDWKKWDGKAPLYEALTKEAIKGAKEATEARWRSQYGVDIPVKTGSQEVPIKTPGSSTPLGNQTEAEALADLDKVYEASMIPVGNQAEAMRRKGIPVASGVIDYFPLALKAIAEVSLAGQKQHGLDDGPMRWARELSADESDALMRHFIDRGKKDTDGLRHSAKMAWRALAYLQKELENDAS